MSTRTPWTKLPRAGGPAGDRSSAASRTPARQAPGGAPAPARGARTWALVGADGRAVASARPGTLGGHRRGRIYGRLDCPSALRAIARGGYVRERVFFLDESAAVAAGFRACAVCMPAEHARYKRARAPS